MKLLLVNVILSFKIDSSSSEKKHFCTIFTISYPIWEKISCSSGVLARDNWFSSRDVWFRTNQFSAFFNDKSCHIYADWKNKPSGKKCVFRCLKWEIKIFCSIGVDRTGGGFVSLQLWASSDERKFWFRNHSDDIEIWVKASVRLAQASHGPFRRKLIVMTSWTYSLGGSTNHQANIRYRCSVYSYALRLSFYRILHVWLQWNIENC